MALPSLHHLAILPPIFLPSSKKEKKRKRVIELLCPLLLRRT